MALYLWEAREAGVRHIVHCTTNTLAHSLEAGERTAPAQRCPKSVP